MFKVSDSKTCSLWGCFFIYWNNPIIVLHPLHSYGLLMYTQHYTLVCGVRALRRNSLFPVTPRLPIILIFLPIFLCCASWQMLKKCFSASQNGKVELKVVEYLSKMQQIMEYLPGMVVECHTPWPLLQGIILNDTPSDGQIVGRSGYRKQGISSKWPNHCFI